MSPSGSWALECHEAPGSRMHPPPVIFVARFERLETAIGAARRLGDTSSDCIVYLRFRVLRASTRMPGRVRMPFEECIVGAPDVQVDRVYAIAAWPGRNPNEVVLPLCGGGGFRPVASEDVDLAETFPEWVVRDPPVRGGCAGCGGR